MYKKSRRILPAVMTAALAASIMMTGCQKGDGADTSKEKTDTSKETSEEVNTSEDANNSKEDSGSGAYSLKQVGTIEDEEGTLWYNAGVITSGESYEYKMLDALGKEMNSDTYYEFDYLHDGYYLACANKEDVNRTGLTDSNSGELLIPCEAAIIETLKGTNDSYGSERYLNVIYAEKATDNESDAMLYTSDMISIYGAPEGATMYTGYTKIYDLQEKAFVDNLKFTKDDEVLYCGDSICLKGDGKYTFYDNKGNILFEKEGLNSSYIWKEGYFSLCEEGKWVFYDSTGKELYSSEHSINLISSKDDEVDYLYEQTGEQGVYKILNLEGKELGEIKCNSIQYECNGVISVTSEDLQYGIVDATGKEIMPFKESLIRCTENGYWYRDSSKDNDDYSDVLTPDGSLHENLEVGDGSDDRLLFEKEDKLYVFAEKDYVIEAEEFDQTDFKSGIVKICKDGNYGVYDVISGTQLLEAKYARVMITEQYVYGYKNEAWDVYEIK